MSDIELLRRYAREGSEEAFATLVRRHVNLVYSAAMRKTNRPDAAEEITQAVFVILAKKADTIRGKTILSGWLYETARLTAACYLRTEIRRARRDQESYMQSLSNETGFETIPEIAPLLDDAMGWLSESERNAVLLRYFEGKSFHEIGAVFGASENAAKKRVAYALEKMRRFFSKRGVVSTTAIVAAAISANSVQAAPIGLANVVNAMAVAKGTAAGSSTLALTKGALKIMAWTKAKMALLMGTSVLLVAATTNLTITEIQAHRTHSWQVPRASFEVLEKTPPQVVIVTTKFPGSDESRVEAHTRNNLKVLGIAELPTNIVCVAYQTDPVRSLFLTALPSDQYDFIANVSDDSAVALQQEVKRVFGVTGRRVVRETDVLLLRIKDPVRLQSRLHKRGFAFPQRGGLSLANERLSDVARKLESVVGKPILDRTGTSGRYDLAFVPNVKSRKALEENLDVVRQTIPRELNEYGLELVPSRERIEVLIVEKGK